MTDAFAFFVTTFAQLAALFVLISLGVAWLRQRLSAARIQALLAGRTGYFTAMGLGSITPFCTCSTIPMLVGLLQARASFGPVMTFLFTSPLLNPFVVVLLWVIFGSTVTLTYAVAVLITAMSAGVVLRFLRFERFLMLPASVDRDSGNSSEARSDWRTLLGQSLDLLRQFLPHLVLGVAVGALVHGYVPETLIAQVGAEPAWWLVPLAAFAGILLYVRASTMLPIAASLVAKGASLGPVMALTIGGTGASLPELIILKRLFRWPLMIAFIVVVLGMACLTGYGLMMLDVRPT